VFVAAGRRLVSLVVLSFALLGFLAVPIGDKTGYEHARTLLATQEAARLGATLSSLASQLKETLLGELQQVGAVKDEGERADGGTSSR
jgi:hypothetical protein